MYHEGQRASEAMCNGIKHEYITCLPLSLLLCHVGSGLLTVVFWSAYYVIPYGNAGKGMYTIQ